MSSELMTLKTGNGNLSLPTRILIGAILGIFVGLFFGSQAAVIRPVGTIYTMLLQAVVYPYIVCTLLSSLGQLMPKLANRLFKRGWFIYLFLLVLTFGAMFLLAIAIPTSTSALKTTTTALAHTPTILDVLIPRNLFEALTNNYVPAVVIFCVLFGIMLQGIKNASTLFKILNTISDTCLLFWRWLINLAPYAVFALLAATAGTIKFNQLLDVGEYLLIFFMGTLLLTFWLLPAIISSLTPISYRRVLYELRGALIISAATTLSVLALPYIRDIVQRLIKQEHINQHSEDTNDVINTTLMVSYPFGQLGNFFLYLFILFASLYFDHSFKSHENFSLPILTFFSSIGSPSTVVNAVSFLTNWLHFPSETPNLYISVMPITRYGQVLVSVMGFAFLTIVITYAYMGRLKIRIKKLLIHIIVVALLLMSFSLLLRNLIPDAAIKTYQRLNSASISSTLTENVKTIMLPAPKKITQSTSDKKLEDALFHIQKTGVLRVGYNADMRPFAFFNNKKQLVGYDIAYAYALANALNVKLEFVPFSWPNLITELEAGNFDIAMSAIYVTEERLAKVDFTTPYFKSPIAFIVPKSQQNQYQDANEIRSIQNLRLGLFKDPVLIPLAKHNFPNAKLIIFPKFANYIAAAFADNKIDAALWSQAQTGVWVLSHPDYVSVSPAHVAAPFLMAYMVRQSSPQFLNFLNYWLQLKQNEGFARQQYNQWILGRPVQNEKPRWSILHNVLHW